MEDAVAAVAVAVGDEVFPVADVLVQRPAQGDVEDLDAAADAQRRQPPVDGRPDERDLEPVADRADVAGLRMGLLAVEHRVDVSPADQQQAVETTQARRCLGFVERDGRHDDRIGPRPLDRLEVGRRARHGPLPPAEHTAGDDGNPGESNERPHSSRVPASSPA